MQPSLPSICALHLHRKHAALGIVGSIIPDYSQPTTHFFQITVLLSKNDMSEIMSSKADKLRGKNNEGFHYMGYLNLKCTYFGMQGSFIIKYIHPHGFWLWIFRSPCGSLPTEIKKTLVCEIGTNCIEERDRGVF